MRDIKDIKDMTSTVKWPRPIDHTYILCDPVREPERAAYLQTWFDSQSIDPSAYTMKLSCYGSDMTGEKAIAVYDPWRVRKPIEQGSSGWSHNLKPSEISLIVNWAHLAQMAVDAGHSVVMMFESDVLFKDDFMNKLSTAIASLQDTEWDFLSISAGANLRPKRPVGELQQKWFHVPGYYHTRTCDAMIFKVSMLKKILSTLFPFGDVLDWEMNYQLTLHSSKSFWLDPEIIVQGSGTGVYPTSL